MPFVVRNLFLLVTVNFGIISIVVPFSAITELDAVVEYILIVSHCMQHHQNFHNGWWWY